ncbi:MAG: PAS domain S-box protein, partial [Candidatus Marinimicrobia bacterium]|nr:PAS domain S-box protein [Candidatus Neomarinimicrobiota bacterium]
MKNKPSDTTNNSIDTVAEAVFIVELPSRKIKYVSNSIEVIFGYEYEECLGKTTELFYPGVKDFKSFGVRLKKAIEQNKEVLQVETRLKRKNGEIFPAEISTSIMRIGDRVNQVISIVRDLTVGKHAQDALQESEEKYKTFFRGSNDAIYLTSTDGKFEDVNDSLQNLFGYTKAELMSMDVEDLYYNREEREKFRHEVETKGSVRDYSLSLKKKDGTEIFCLLTSNVRRNQNDKIIGYQGIIRDISSKIKAEEELQKFSNAIEHAAEMIMITDKEGNIQYVNPEFERLTGFNKQDVLGKTPRILKSGKHPDEFYKKMWATILAGYTFRGLIINKKKNGEIFYEEKTISPLKDADGNITHFVSNGRDITERINAQKKIEEQRKFLRQVLDINPNIIFAKDREGKFTLANKAMAELLNTTIKNIIGKTSRDFNLDEEGQAMILRDDKDVFNTLREVNSPENTLIDPKGNKHIFHTIKRPVMDENGNASHILAVLMDITDQKKSENEKFNLERKLERARRMESLGILAGGVAHDLNNILGPILGYPDLILSTLPQNSP